MPLYVYEGPGTSISIAGRTLNRGVPTMLEGRAAESAAAHSDVREETSEPLDALAGYRALRARARELGIPASGKAPDLAEAIAAEEARLG